MAQHGENVDGLRALIQSHPLIDNHAHNILSAQHVLNYKSYPLESVTSEAHGEALRQSQQTLPHHIAVKQLATLFSCEPSWEAIKAAREEWVTRDYKGFVKKCLEGTHALLLDDLITDSDIEDYKWHDHFTASKTKRIVRIETVASKVLDDLSVAEQTSSVRPTLTRFVQFLKQRIRRDIKDPEVVGFKSVVCYRTGLDVAVTPAPTAPHAADYLAAVEKSFQRIVRKGAPFRIADKAFNDYVVTLTLDVIQEAAEWSDAKTKPIQFHTGLGDSDLDLVRANPAYLQPLITQYKKIDFVLLHSSYPYTREAGYLASVYPNVYLDLGEVFPMVSRDAEESILRQSFDLTPTIRLLWSTDGHFHPETFWLSNKQFRDALETVLVDYVQKGSLTLEQAKQTTKDILFNNSNVLYNLNLPPPKDKDMLQLATRSTESEATLDLDTLVTHNPNLVVWVQWVDYTATVRVRMFPLREFVKIVKNQRRIGITLAVLHMLQDDLLAPGGATTGQFYMRPDLSTFTRNAALNSNSATVMTFWKDENGKDLEGCPRTTLHRVVTALKPIQVTLGFEIEVVFLRKSDQDGGEWKPLTKTHSWSNMTTDIRQNALSILEEIVTTLASIDIHLEQFHAESAPGQFEFILPPASPLAAVDTLLKARQTVQHVAEKHGLRATLYPRPYPFAAGTASHAHFSISPTSHEEPFLAGVLEHFPSITAFSLSQEISYSRVASGVWAGSEWVTWGSQNRETPIRKIEAGHWELKSIDGLANMYFAMAALLAAGLIGIANETPLMHADCPVDAATLSTEEREMLGIVQQIPKTLEQSLAALEADKDLRRIMGPRFVERYCAVKRAENQKLAAMEEGERKQWLIERY
ncbi:extracellular developmental signal biosynthesis protein FluG [Talaromyces proteolyticus]|uniref:Glutamine synthetase n=1 Tax=Talaromyces proteolyticus TaxID=1131652 RepID=A0AAD4PVB2_9EURO|nr:extracellular developmental signal biosynthesis protein FluG [Talaromyces proteolyticus]KAH8690533.1 extracellular developmental signal biosynthesis protein FluG [Talaromyces proteolyticus]